MKTTDNKSLEDSLRHKGKNKANEVFLRLLSKQKSKFRDWSDVRAETYPTKEIKPGADSE